MKGSKFYISGKGNTMTKVLFAKDEEEAKRQWSKLTKKEISEVDVVRTLGTQHETITRVIKQEPPNPDKQTKLQDGAINHKETKVTASEK